VNVYFSGLMVLVESDDAIFSLISLHFLLFPCLKA